MTLTNFTFETPVSTSNLYAPKLERVIELVETAASADRSLSIGVLVAELERRLCEYHNACYCVSFSTGFWALVAAARLRALPHRTQVIIPSLTYRRLADVVHWAGKVPHFVDVAEGTLAICPDAVEAAINQDTALVLAVHPIVNCCDAPRLISLAERQQVPIIFDAVESVHETIAGRRIGSFGVGEVFSLHASKLINGMEGGYVCTNDCEFARSLVDFRQTQSQGARGMGINGVLNDAHAALAIAGLEEIDINVRHNRAIYLRYLNNLDSIDGLRVLEFGSSQQTSFKNVVAEVTEEFPLSRDQLVQRLNADGILARAYYAPALHNKTYDYPVITAPMRVTPRAVEKFINLPCGQRVSEEDVDRVCHYLGNIVHGAKLP